MKKTLLLLLVSISGFSQTLDPTFDSDGILKVQNSNLPSTQKIHDAALQADGKMVYAGMFNYPFLQYFVARYNADGSKDNTFNQKGFKKIYIPYSPSITKLFIQDDGKILVAGNAGISRVLTNGDYDVSFSDDGYQGIIFGGQVIKINDVSVQTDNKIILTGQVSNQTNNDFTIVRLNSDGTFDTTFDNDGALFVSIASGTDNAYAHKIQPDGKIVVFGNTYNGTDYDFAMARINPDGSLDTSFGNNGKVVTSFGAGNDNGKAGEILSDGRILMFGSASGKFAFASYTSSGILDTTFDTDGKLTLNHNLSANTPRLKVLSDGKILASGTSNNDYKVIKLLTDGSYDTSFDNDGVAIINDDTDISAFLLEKPDGKIVTGGYSATTGATDYRIKQIELNTNGSIFSNTVKNLYLSYDTANTALQLSDQSYLVLSVSHNSEEKLLLSKFLANGTRDLSFGTSGTLDLGFYQGTKKIIILPDGKIVVPNGTFIYKINPNGTLDTTFGSGGVIDLYPLGNHELQFIDDFILSNDGKLLLACDYVLYYSGSSAGSYTDTAVVKLNLNGTFDTTFGTNGLLHYTFSNSNPIPNNNHYEEWPAAIYQDINNKIIVASVSSLDASSTTVYTPNTSIYLSKLNPNGTFDTTFGTNGVYLYTHNTPTVGINNITSSSDNNYLVNFNQYSSAVDENLASKKSYTLKINNNSGVYTAFGTNGLTNDISGSFNSSMIMQPDGKFIKAGTKNKQFSISRYNTDGSIDTSFGVNGEISTPIDFSSNITDILLQTDGKLLATGTSFDGDRQVLTLVRYGGLNLGTLDLTKGKNALMVYPNPIEREATFQYTLDHNETVSIAIIDVQGKVIKKVVTNEPQNAGQQSVRFSLDENVSSGNYFLRIASGKGSQSVQIIKK